LGQNRGPEKGSSHKGKIINSLNGDQWLLPGSAKTGVGLGVQGYRKMVYGPFDWIHKVRDAGGNELVSLSRIQDGRGRGLGTVVNRRQSGVAVGERFVTSVI